MTDDPSAFRLFNEIGIIEQLSRNLFEGVLPKGMTSAQFTVLNHFVRLSIDEKSPSQLAGAFQITRATMTSTLTRMEKAGLIAVRADPADGRGKLISISAQGRAMRERCVAAVGTLLPQFEHVLAEIDVPGLIAPLERIRIALDKARD